MTLFVSINETGSSKLIYHDSKQISEIRHHCGLFIRFVSNFDMKTGMKISLENVMVMIGMGCVIASLILLILCTILCTH